MKSTKTVCGGYFSRQVVLTHVAQRALLASPQGLDGWRVLA